ncbi:hypothetical protein LPU83_pLPU83c_0058 (plasmid) [Rhizobium favelukesii]|uniref:Uncharacterized protein n=1 Tax=Rhizobium favelukesii TaxID=348824 RepID=W6RJX8_9HYPH|nr:hypothetical protein LPU83_pLPU83c_0058 [Rhizobium favelukesii]
MVTLCGLRHEQGLVCRIATPNESARHPASVFSVIGTRGSGPRSAWEVEHCRLRSRPLASSKNIGAFVGEAVLSAGMGSVIPIAALILVLVVRRGSASVPAIEARIGNCDRFHYEPKVSSWLMKRKTRSAHSSDPALPLRAPQRTPKKGIHP